MKLEYWINLSAREKLLAGLFTITFTLSSVVSYMYLEIRKEQKEQKAELKIALAESNKKLEFSEIARRNAEVDCGKEKLIMVEKLLEEQKLANQKQQEVNEKQNEIIYSNRNYVNSTKTVMNKLNRVIPKKK